MNATGVLQWLAQGDAVTQASALLLLAMSVASWVVIGWKWRLLRRARRDVLRCTTAFWQAPDLGTARQQFAAFDRESLLLPMLDAAHAVAHPPASPTGTARLAQAGSTAQQLTRVLRDALHRALGTLQFGAWGRQLGLGEGLFVLLLAPAFFEPLRDLSAAWHDRASGQAALVALAGLAEPGADSRALPGAQVNKKAGTDSGADRDTAMLAWPLVPGALSVVLRGVCFAPSGERAVLNHFDLDVAAGEQVALVGPSGSGKTTLLGLVAGLIAPDTGSIAIGGISLAPDTASALRLRMAWMGQKPHVFAGSVASNVALGRAEVQAPQVLQAMRFASLQDVAQAHPASTLGEGGSGLSGGEAVRLALARVAVHECAGLLLVDEPTAHLDSDTARRVTDALLQLAQGKTLLVATHDPVLAARLGRVVELPAAAGTGTATGTGTGTGDKA